MNENGDINGQRPGAAAPGTLQGADYPAPLAGDELVPASSERGLLEGLETSELRERVEAGIRERPLLSLGLGLFAGFLIGRALRD